MGSSYQRKAMVAQRMIWGFALANLAFLIVTVVVYYDFIEAKVVAATGPETALAESPAPTPAPARPRVAARPMPTVLKLKPARDSIYRPRIRSLSASADEQNEPTEPESLPTPPPDETTLSAAPEPQRSEDELTQQERRARLRHELNLPDYEILHATSVGGSGRMYAEILAPNLEQNISSRELKRVAKNIAEVENLDSLVLYCTREAHLAHYSMSYSDEHPQALKDGLMCYIDRGWFKRAGPKDWGLSSR